MEAWTKGHCFADDIVRSILVAENYHMLIKIVSKFVPNGLIRSIDNDSTGFWPPGSLHTLGADGHI